MSLSILVDCRLANKQHKQDLGQICKQITTLGQIKVFSLLLKDFQCLKVTTNLGHSDPNASPKNKVAVPLITVSLIEGFATLCITTLCKCQC